MPAKKSTTKSSGKFGNILRKLNPNSPKKKLLLFVLIFGVIAGGFYAYRSFASTGSSSRRIRDTSPQPSVVGRNYTNYNGNSKFPTWTLWNEGGSYRSLSQSGVRACVWGRVINDSHGYALISRHARQDFSFRQDRSSDRRIFCYNADDRIQVVTIQVNGIIEFTNIETFWAGSGK